MAGGIRSLFFLRRHFRVYVSGFGARRTLRYAIRFVSLTAVRHGLRRRYHFVFLPRAPLACSGFFITTCPKEISVLNVFQILLLVFSVTPFKIDQNKKSKPFNRLSPESRNRKKVDMQRPSPRFRSQEFFLWKICGETFYPNL